jgi:hypothetical protein
MSRTTFYGNPKMFEFIEKIQTISLYPIILRNQPLKVTELLQLKLDVAEKQYLKRLKKVLLRFLFEGYTFLLKNKRQNRGALINFCLLFTNFF